MAKVLVPLAEGCEELEAISIIDILRRAEVDVVTAALGDGPVRASQGTVLVADMSLDDAKDGEYDMIVLPGGIPGANHLEADPRVIGLLKSMAADGKYVCAICAAPVALARAGVLLGKKVTSYPGFLDALESPGFEYTGGAVEKDGHVITSRGPGTAMDFALELVEALQGAAIRKSVEDGLVR
jgi:4-methyl-5(b-hydroxyethyl)-thiazole monophosphate biosynthesis